MGTIPPATVEVSGDYLQVTCNVWADDEGRIHLGAKGGGADVHIPVRRNTRADESLRKLLTDNGFIEPPA